MALHIRALNFIGYRFINLAIEMDNVGTYIPEVKAAIDREDPHDMLRTTYPLNKDSLVVDIGGFTGDWAMRMYCLYSCFIDIYEPHPDLAGDAARNFRGNAKINTYAIGVGGENGILDLYGNTMNASLIPNSIGTVIKVPVRKASELFKERYGDREIDLLKINIEGAEYDVVPDLINNWDFSKVYRFLVQFHNSVPGYQEKREACRKLMSKTHMMVWNYDYLFESWVRKDKVDV